MAASPLKGSLALQVGRVGGVVISVFAVGAAFEWLSDIAIAQAACNLSPNRPTSVYADRAPDGRVFVAWNMATGGCEATRFYVEAWRGPEEVIEHTVSSGSERSVLLPLGAATADPWRIYVRAFNSSGLGSRHCRELHARRPYRRDGHGALPECSIVERRRSARELLRDGVYAVLHPHQRIVRANTGARAVALVRAGGCRVSHTSHYGDDADVPNCSSASISRERSGLKVPRRRPSGTLRLASSR